MTPEELKLLIYYADYGADEKENWLDCGEDGVEAMPSERKEIAEVRALISRLIK